MRARRQRIVQAVGIFALLTFTLNSRAAPSDETYLKFNDVKCEGHLAPTSSACYQQVLKNFAAVTARPGIIQLTKLTYDKDGYSEYKLSPVRAKHVIVAIHGLWGDSSQFSDTILNLTWAHDKDFSVISLTLPGHLKFENMQSDSYKNEVARHPPFATFDKWVDALDETMKVAQLLGDEVTVIGQSTGGLLSVIAAVKYPQQVTSIVLIEPALKVRPLLNFGSCALGGMLTNSSIARGFGKLIHNIPAGVNIKMGCEVQRLADTFLSRLNSSASENHNGYLGAIEALALKVKQPVYLMNNEHDGVVETQVNRAFFNSLKNKKIYQSVNLDGKTPHGLITSTAVSSIALAIDEILSIASGYGAYETAIYGTLLQQQFRAATITGENRLSLNKFDSIALDRRLCEFVEQKDCGPIQSALKTLRSFHQQSLQGNHPDIRPLFHALAPACQRLNKVAFSALGVGGFEEVCVE